MILYQLAVADFRRPIASGWESLVEDELIRADIAAATDGQPAQRLAAARDLADRLRSLPERRAERAREAELQKAAAAAKQQLERARLIRPWRVAAIFTLVVGLVVSSALAVMANRARQRAEHEARIALAINSFMNERLAAQADPDLGQVDITFRQALKGAIENAPEQFRQHPDIEAALRISAGAMFDHMEAYADALESDRKAIGLLEKLPADDTTRALLAEARIQAGATLARNSNLDDAHAMLDSIPPPPSVRLSVMLNHARGVLAQVQFQYSQALTFYENAVRESQDPNSGVDNTERYANWQNEVDCLIRLARYDEARNQVAALMASIVKTLGPDSSLLLWARFSSAEIDRFEGHHEAALAAFEKLVPDFSAKMGADAEKVIEIKSEIAELLDALERWPEAIKVQQDVLDRNTKSVGPDHTATVVANVNFAIYLSRVGDFKAAVAIFDRVLPVIKKRFGETHVLTQQVEVAFSDPLISLGQLDRAASFLDGMNETKVGEEIPSDENSAEVDFEKGRLAVALGQKDRAEAYLQASLKAQVADKSSGNWMTRSSNEMLSRLAEAEKRR